TFQSSQLKCSIGTRQRVWPAGYMEPSASSSEFETPRAANVFASSACPSPFVSSDASRGLAAGVEESGRAADGSRYRGSDGRLREPHHELHGHRHLLFATRRAGSR